MSETKKKIGRPRVNNDNVRRNLNISKALLEKIDAAAAADNRSFNNYVATVLKKHIEELEAGE